ncbi:MAG: T9SS type A sorting domain-containing protein [Ignavibacteriales bacterium]|nr:T9SS type A sorting domain-containing protein [Ignavibacteriales bacterium]
MFKKIFSLFVVTVIVFTSTMAGTKSYVAPKQKLPAKAEVIAPAKTEYVSGARKTSPHRDSPNDLSWIMVDSMPNVYGVSIADANPLCYDPWNNHVAMIYRGAQNYNPPNATTGSLWYGASPDEFGTWNRVGKINADVDQYGRYPSSAISNPNHSSTPADAIFEYSYPHLTGGSAFGSLGYGLDPFLQNTPFTTIVDADYSSQTYIWTDESTPYVYFLAERTGPPALVELWVTPNQGETWSVAKTWDVATEWTSLWGERGQTVGNTVYVEATVYDSLAFGAASPWVPAFTKSTDNGTTWSEWELVDWRTIPVLSNYDEVGTNDGRIAHDFVVDANGMEHWFCSVIDTNPSPDVMDIVEVFRTASGWDANIIARRTLSFVPGFAALTQMDNELFATISEDRTAFAIKWVDAPAEGETQGDIFAAGRKLGQGWGPAWNLTQTNDGYGREMSTHLATRCENPTGNLLTIYVTKTEQLAVVPDSMLDDTQPCAIWGSKYVLDITTGIQERESGLPSGFALYRNYPNPFNPSTKIAFDIPSAMNVSLKIYDVTGKELETLYNGYQQAGKYEAVFNASKYASGVYLYKLQAGSFSATEKMILTK